MHLRAFGLHAHRQGELSMTNGQWIMAAAGRPVAGFAPNWLQGLIFVLALAGVAVAAHHRNKS